MADIKLTKGKIAIVDDEDYVFLSQFKWHFMNRYAYHAFKEMDWREIAMHRLLIDVPQGMEVDHINGNGLDNRKANLRVVTVAQNQMNTGINKKNTSGHKGVTYHKRDKYWQAAIRVNGKRKYLGSYKNLEDAALAYINAAELYHGEYRRGESING